MKYLNLVFCLTLLNMPLFPGAFAQFESPGKGNECNLDILFIIERSRDADKVYYEIALDEYGRLNEQEPIKAYWIRHTRNNQTEPLTRIQENFSYGLVFSEITTSGATFQFTSSSERDFELRKTPQGNYRVYTLSANQEMEVQKVWIEFAGGTYLVPKIGRIDLYLKDLSTGKTIIEALNPK